MKSLTLHAKTWLLSIAAADPSVADAAIMGNLRRLRWLLLAMIVLNLVLVGVFWFALDGDSPRLLAWKNAIGWTNLGMAVWLLVLWVAAGPLSRRETPNGLARLVQILAPFSFVFFTVAITVIDQMVTPNISPFLLGNVFVGLLLLMRPMLAVCVFLVGYLLLYVGLGLTQADPGQLLSNRANGFAATVMSIVLSIVLWSKNTVYALLRCELETRNAALLHKQEELVWLAKRDALTGLFNRGEFLRIAELELKRAQRHGTDTSAIMLDLDLFKNINDTYGHPAGDSVLKHTANCLLGGVRNIDIVARIGGEEFIVLLPQTSQGDAVALAEKLLRVLRQSPTQITSELQIAATSSLGVGSLLAGQQGTVASLYAAADHALYEAKRLGRDRVEKTEPDGSLTPSDFQRMRRK